MLRVLLWTGSLVVAASPGISAQDAPLQLAVIQNEKAPWGQDIKLVVPADGYVLLIQSVDGEVHVMFPARPGSSAALPAGAYNLSRLNTTIPYANGRRYGEMVAIWSQTPIQTAEFVRYGHWATGSLSRQEFKRDPVSATIDLAARLGAGSGMAASVEYGRDVIAYDDTLPVSRYQGSGDNQVWLVYQNLARIQGRCPEGTRDVIGSGEYCSAPSERPRSAPRRIAEQEPVYVPPRPLQSPATARPAPPPPPPAARPVTPPPAERRPSKQPL